MMKKRLLMKKGSSVKTILSIVLTVVICLNMLCLIGENYKEVTAASTKKVTCVNLGESHNAAILEDGSLWTWGSNDEGELGDGTTESRYKPVKVMDDVKKVIIREENTAAIKTDGSLWAWGLNGFDFGNLGDGTTQDRHSPVKIMNDVADVSFDSFRTAAIKTDGSLWMWGLNDEGELGDGTYEGRSKPVKIMEDVKSVSLISNTTAAVKTDGSLWIWGANTAYMIGGDEVEGSTKPIKVMDDVEKVFLHDYNIAVIKRDSSLWMWGDNDQGQLGIQGLISDTPIKIMDNVSSIQFYHGYCGAIKTDGSLWMWGKNYEGQLGNGTFDNSSVPVKVMSNISKARLDFNYVGALNKEGKLYMWGLNYSGQLGNGTDDNSNVPTKVLDDVTDFNISDNRSGAIKKDGSLWIWGANYDGYLGDGTTENRYKPVQIMFDDESGEDTNIYTITYDANGGTGAPPVQTINKGSLFPISTIVPTRVGYEFMGWGMTSDATSVYPSGGSIKVNDNMTLYAIWRKLPESFEKSISLDHGSISVSYSHSFFKASSITYNHNLARFCSALSLLAYSDKKKREKGLKDLGFSTNGSDYNFNLVSNKESNGDEANYSITKKTIYIDGKAKTLVLCMIDGTKGREWMTNFNPGTGDTHQSFQKSEKFVLNNLKKYISDHNISRDELKLLITGHSRGAAVSNLLAAEIDANNLFTSRDNVFAYTFATPRPTKKSGTDNSIYNNIFNIVNPEDFVTKVPVQTWGFKRYGITHTLPSKTNNESLLILPILKWAKNIENSIF